MARNAKPVTSHLDDAFSLNFFGADPFLNPSHLEGYRQGYENSMLVPMTTLNTETGLFA